MKPRILYIVGSGRSGSTLLDLLLGSHPEIESGGECYKYARYFSPSSMRPDNKRICTCGMHVHECGYWKAVREVLMRNYGEVNFDLETPDADRFIEWNRRVIDAILDVSGKAMFVDSSKHFHRLRRLVDSGAFEVAAVHLVRDGRAVAFSGARKGYEVEKMLQEWRHNVGWKAALRSMHGVPYKLVRYEDLTADPDATLKSILDLIDLEFDKSMLRFRDVAHHNLAGNRMRMAGSSEIRRDDEYLTRTGFIDWCGMTWRIRKELREFRYPLLRG